MLDLLHRLAVALKPLAWAAPAGAVCCALLLLANVLAGVGRDWLLPPSLIGLLWFLSLAALIGNFAQVPSRQVPAGPALRRAGHRLKRAGYWLLAAVFVATSGAALYVSLRVTLVVLDS